MTVHFGLDYESDTKKVNWMWSIYNDRIVYRRLIRLFYRNPILGALIFNLFYCIGQGSTNRSVPVGPRFSNFCWSRSVLDKNVYFWTEKFIFGHSTAGSGPCIPGKGEVTRLLVQTSDFLELEFGNFNSAHFH